jgi:hypothetical protein
MKAADDIHEQIADLPKAGNIGSNGQSNDDYRDPDLQQPAVQNQPSLWRLHGEMITF